MFKNTLIASSIFAATSYARNLLDDDSISNCYNMGEMYFGYMPPTGVSLFRPIEPQVQEIEVWYGEAFEELREECGFGEYHIWCGDELAFDIYKVDYTTGYAHLELSMENLNDMKYPDQYADC